MYCPPPPTKPTLLHSHCAIHARPPTPPVYAIHHTLCVMAISCEGQTATLRVSQTQTNKEKEETGMYSKQKLTAYTIQQPLRYSPLLVDRPYSSMLDQKERHVAYKYKYIRRRGKRKICIANRSLSQKKKPSIAIFTASRPPTLTSARPPTRVWEVVRTVAAPHSIVVK